MRSNLTHDEFDRGGLIPNPAAVSLENFGIVSRDDNVCAFTDFRDGLAGLFGGSETHITDLGQDFFGIFDGITREHNAPAICLGKS
jgi:hypothetical protein